MSTLPWPTFWNNIAEADRQPLRDILSELLRYGVIFGDEGSGRDRFRLVREHLRTYVEGYFAPLGLRLLVLDDPPLIQIQPIPEECDLLARFTLQETLLALVLWLMYDEAQLTNRSKAVLFSVNEFWNKCRIIFDRLNELSPNAMKEALVRFRRKRLIRFEDSEDPSRPGDGMIEVLPTLARVIDFAGLEEWQARAAVFQKESEAAFSSESLTPVMSSP
jgi:hypothetical protein